jgi:hypothetical protein
VCLARHHSVGTHPNVAQFIAPDLLHQLGVVATLDINPAGQRALRPTGQTDNRTRGGPGGHRPRSRRSLEHHRSSLVPESRAEGKGPLLPVPVPKSRRFRSQPFECLATQTVWHLIQAVQEQRNAARVE